MTYYDVFVGRLDDPTFDYDGGGDPNGNIPMPISPIFPDSRELFFKVLRRIDTKVYVGKQVDWGAWAAKASKAEVLAFITEAFHHDPKTLSRLKEELNVLSPTETYALIAAET